MAKRKLISFDWALKRLLRSKANFEILEGFLSELLHEQITIVDVLESETNKETKDGKYSRIDLKVKNTKGEIILIEVQYDDELDFLQRILYGVSRAITEHFKQGEPYSQVIKVISIAIVYFDLGQGSDYVYHGSTTFIGLHNQEVLALSPRQKNYLSRDYPAQLFPEMYIIKVKNFDDLAKNTLDEWIYFLKNEEIKDEFKAQGLKKAKQELDIMKMTDEERREYESYLLDLSYRASMVDSSYGVGKFDGLKEGEEKGIEKGIKKGRALEIVKMAEEGDISNGRAMEKLHTFRAEIQDDNFWLEVDESLKKIP
jgi:predicted transposase/invertase (TIGR01784 family)